MRFVRFVEKPYSTYAQHSKFHVWHKVKSVILSTSGLGRSSSYTFILFSLFNVGYQLAIGLCGKKKQRLRRGASGLEEPRGGGATGGVSLHTGRKQPISIEHGSEEAFSLTPLLRAVGAACV